MHNYAPATNISHPFDYPSHRALLGSTRPLDAHDGVRAYWGSYLELLKRIHHTKRRYLFVEDLLVAQQQGHSSKGTTARAQQHIVVVCATGTITC